MLRFIGVIATALVGTVSAEYYSSIGCSSPDCLELKSNDCQNLDNCPYSYNNTMSDYVPGSTVAISSELRDFMATQYDIYLNKVTNQYPPTNVDTYDVFQGVGGRAFMQLRIFDRTGDTKHLLAAQEYIDVALSGVNKIGNYVGFLWGRTGN
jgi:hypothetical protein